MRFRDTLPGLGKEKHMQVFEKLAEYRYEQLVFCHDKATGLRAIVAIHDTTLGPALGGCRMYPYATEEDAVVDVLRLARGMTYKAAASGLNLGGGKSVIIGDPYTDKSETLFRSFGRYIETLGGRYIVAEDVGTSTEDANFIRVETSYVVGVDVTRGGSGDPSPFTALGVVQGMRACVEEIFSTTSLEGRTVAVQGLGHVGGNLCRLLAEEGARLINAGGLINVADELEGYNERRATKRVMRIEGRIRRILAISRRDGVPTNVAADTLALERIAAIGSMERLHTGHPYGQLSRRRETI
jgi:glutamate dehydrogenase/leucine dehydrogenase